MMNIPYVTTSTLTTEYYFHISQYYQFVVMLASPGARGVFKRALVVQGWIYSEADE